MKKIQIVPLGGLGEIGKNMTAIRYNDEIVVVDAGLAFPEEDMFGIDVVIPDFDYIRKNKQQVKKVVITHAHEDHIGGLPYFLKEFPDIPVYATKLTAALIRNKLKNHKLGTKKIQIINEKSIVKTKECEISFFPTNHSIPGSVGVVVETPIGSVVHTGDFKIDLTPLDGRTTDFQRLGEIGKKGVLALLSDSTNAEKTGLSPSEREIGRNLEREISSAKGRVIVATFASSLYRVQNLFNIAKKLNKKMVVLGRSMEANVKIASKLGELNIPDGVWVDTNEMKEIDNKDLMILTTGAQGESLAGLARIANGDHRYVEIQSNDTVIFSSSPIPGNEKTVSALIDLLYKKGVNVVYGREKGIHTSGHGNQDEQRLMLSILKPKYFIPVHGEYRMQLKHKELAKQVGLKEENVFICENGDVIEITESKADKQEKVQAGAVLVDNSGLGDIDDWVMKDRKRLAEHGVFAVVADCTKTKKRKVKVQFELKGIIAKVDKGLLNKELTELISKKLEENAALGAIRKELYGEISSILRKHIKRNPTIILLINNYSKKEGFK